MNVKTVVRTVHCQSPILIVYLQTKHVRTIYYLSKVMDQVSAYFIIYHTTSMLFKWTCYHHAYCGRAITSTYSIISLKNHHAYCYLYSGYYSPTTLTV
jgi:hypothetical protein